MWQIVFDKSALKQLDKLSPDTQATIKDGLQNQRWIHLPRRTGGSWFAIPSLLPVRVGNYRIVCNIHNTEDMVSIIDIRYDPR